ncbi:MAG: hypothetical protein LUG44_02530 [Clostridiales bacterium]|nr:hypothetical protein [Clostridiales bacterium]
MAKSNNREIRQRISKGGFYYWEVAQAMGVSAGTLCLWLREELTGERLTRVLAALDTLEGRGK